MVAVAVSYKMLLSKLEYKLFLDESTPPAVGAEWMSSHLVSWREQRTSSWADGKHREERTIWADGGLWKDLGQVRVKEPKKNLFRAFWISLHLSSTSLNLCGFSEKHGNGGEARRKQRPYCQSCTARDLADLRTRRVFISSLVTLWVVLGEGPPRVGGLPNSVTTHKLEYQCFLSQFPINKSACFSPLLKVWKVGLSSGPCFPFFLFRIAE